ncbi:hypothetical protein, partial [Idiomarina baltica]|uniref:hypothetical protein n=1 Tax=Idiomarina baltica TaxID=190892 RepID=UPI002353841A
GRGSNVSGVNSISKVKATRSCRACKLDTVEGCEQPTNETNKIATIHALTQRFGWSRVTKSFKLVSIVLLAKDIS